MELVQILRHEWEERGLDASMRTWALIPRTSWMSLSTSATPAGQRQESPWKFMGQLAWHAQQSMTRDKAEDEMDTQGCPPSTTCVSWHMCASTPYTFTKRQRDDWLVDNTNYVTWPVTKMKSAIACFCPILLRLCLYMFTWYMCILVYVYVHICVCVYIWKPSFPSSPILLLCNSSELIIST